jgi:hypothetical protein
MFLVAILISAFAIWMWRLVFNLDGLKRSLVAKTGTAARTRLNTQQGFMSLSRSFRQSAKYKTRRNSKGGIKAPWGW